MKNSIIAYNLHLMKKIIAYIFLLTTTIVVAQSTENNTEQLKKSKVLSITVMGGTMDEFGNVSPIRSKKEYRKYDTQGLLSQEIIYNSSSAIVTSTNFAHTKNGAINKYLVKDANNATTKKQECTFNSNELKTVCKGTEGTKSYEINYKYDGNNNQTYRKKTYGKDSVAFECTSTYQNNKLASEKFTGKPLVEINYSYDSLGKLIAKTTSADSVLSFSFSYKYNQKGFLTEEIKTDANNVMVEKFVYEYIEDVLVKSISKINNYGYLVMLWKYIYDDKSNIEKINIYEGDTKTPLYQSEYLYKYYQ